MSRSPALLIIAPDEGKSGASRAALVRLLRREFGAAVARAPHPEGLVAGAARALGGGAFGAAVVLDGCGARAALPAIQQGWALPSALASFADDPPFPAARRDLRCAPEALWRFETGLQPLRTDGLWPGAVHSAGLVEAAWVKRRVRELVDRSKPAPAARKTASVIVPCWNNLRYTKACVRSVLRCTARPYELILVDNGSTDGTPAFLRGLEKAGKARVIRNAANLGFGRAVNQGMKAAKGDYLVWLNNDAVVTPGWLGRLIACAERAPWIGAVGPLVNDDGARARASSADRVAAALALRDAGQAAPAPFLLGFCALIKREAVERVGLLDTRFGQGLYEDYDYSLRLRQAGFELATAQDAYVFHHWHRSFESPAGLRRRSHANRDLFIDKWCRLSLDFLTRLPTDPGVKALGQ